jgi:hypothetical protein
MLLCESFGDFIRWFVLLFRVRLLLRTVGFRSCSVLLLLCSGMLSRFGSRCVTDG